MGDWTEDTGDAGWGNAETETETETGMAESWRGGGTLIFNFSTMRRRLGRVFPLSFTLRVPDLLFCVFFFFVFSAAAAATHTRVPCTLLPGLSLSQSLGLAAPSSLHGLGLVCGPDLRSEMSGWQKCLNAITNLTFHITSKASHSHSVKSSQVNSMRYIRAMLTRPRDTAPAPRLHPVSVFRSLKQKTCRPADLQTPDP